MPSQSQDETYSSSHAPPLLGASSKVFFLETPAVEAPWAPVADVELFDRRMDSWLRSSEPHVDVLSCALAFTEEARFTRGIQTFALLLLAAGLGLAILGLQLDVGRAYDFNGSVQNLFQLESLKDVTTRDGVWAWLLNVWAPALFSDRLDAATSVQRSDPVPPALTGNTEFIILDHNKVAKSPTLRQYRYKTRACHGLKTNLECLEPFEEAPFGPGNKYSFQPHIGYEVTFRVNDRTELPTGIYYNATNLLATTQALSTLKADDWLDRRTAFLVAQCLIFNPHYQLLANLRVVFVMSRAGHVISYARAFEEFFLQHLGSALTIFRLSLYHQPLDYLRAVFEGLFVLLLIGVIIKFVRGGISAYQLTGTLRGYFSPRTEMGRQTWLNLIVIVPSILAIGTHVYFIALHATEDFSDTCILSTNFKTDARTLYFVVSSILVLAFTLRLVSSIGFNTQWRFLTITFERAGAALFHFGFIFLTLLWFYAFSGFYYFGHNLTEFRGIWRGVETLLSFAASGQTTADVTAMSAPGADVSAGVFPTLYYWSFMFLIVLVMINMFLTIILSAYKEAEKEIENPIPQRQWYRRIMGPAGQYVLDLFQHQQWLDLVNLKFTVTTARVQISEEELTLRVPSIGPVAQNVEIIYLVIPASMDISAHSITARWIIKESGQDQETTSPCQLTYANRRGASYPIVLAIERPAGFHWFDYHCNISVGLRPRDEDCRSPQLFGETHIYWTQTGQLAVGWEISLRQSVPAIPLHAAVPLRGLRTAPWDAEREPPKRVNWETLSTWCRRSFPVRTGKQHA